MHAEIRPGYILLFFALIVPGVMGLNALGVGFDGIAILITGGALITLFGPKVVAYLRERERSGSAPLWKFLLAPPLEAYDEDEEAIESTLALPTEDEQVASTPFTATLAASAPTPRPLVEQQAVHSLNDPRAYGDRLYLAPDLRPRADELLSGRISIIGISGSGKSNTVAVLCEELACKWVPFMLCDTEDEYAPLCDECRTWLPRGYLVGSPHALHEAVKPLPHFIPVDYSGAFAFGQLLLEQGFQVILNLASYSSADEAALVMTEVIKGMRAWEQSRERPDERVSCMVILEEAAAWLPQKVEESVLEKEVLNELQSTIFNDVVRRGRKQGIGFALATQRIAEIDKRALQSSWRFLHQQTEDTDLRRYKAIVPSIEQETIIGFLPGECIVTNHTGIHRHRIRLRHSPHGAHTPGLESVVRRYVIGRKAARLHTRDLLAFACTAGLDLPQQTDAPTPEITYPFSSESKEVETVQFQPVQQSKQSASDLDRAAAAWKAGANSVRKLQRSLGVSQYQAYELYRQLKERRLV